MNQHDAERLLGDSPLFTLLIIYIYNIYTHYLDYYIYIYFFIFNIYILQKRLGAAL